MHPIPRSSLFLVIGPACLFTLAGCSSGAVEDSALRAEISALAERVKSLEAQLDGQKKEVITERVVVRDGRAKGEIVIGAMAIGNLTKSKEERFLKPAASEDNVAHFGLWAAGEGRQVGLLLKADGLTMKNEVGATAGLGVHGGKHPFSSLSLSTPNTAEPAVVGGAKDSSIFMHASQGMTSVTLSGTSSQISLTSPEAGEVNVGALGMLGLSLTMKHTKGPSVQLDAREDLANLRVRQSDGNGFEVDAHAELTAVTLRHSKGQTIGLTATDELGQLELFEDRGHEKTEAGVNFNRGPSVVLSSSDDFAQVSLSREGTLNKTSDNERASLSVFKNGLTDLKLRDQDGKAAVQIGVAELVDTKTGEKTTTAPGVTFFGLDGNVIQRLPR